MLGGDRRRIPQSRGGHVDRIVDGEFGLAL